MADADPGTATGAHNVLPRLLPQPPLATRSSWCLVVVPWSTFGWLKVRVRVRVKVRVRIRVRIRIRIRIRIRVRVKIRIRVRVFFELCRVADYSVNGVDCDDASGMCAKIEFFFWLTIFNLFGVKPLFNAAYSLRNF